MAVKGVHFEILVFFFTVDGVAVCFGDSLTSWTGDNGVAADEIIEVLTDDDLSEKEIVDLSSMPDSSEDELGL